MTQYETCNVFLMGGPCSGKSATALEVAGALKREGIDAEYVDEYAKRLTWFKRHIELRDQVNILGKQNKAMGILQGVCQVVVTDSPIILSLIYANESTPPALDLVGMDLFRSYSNRLVILQDPNFEKYPYNSLGRNQSQEEAEALHRRVRLLLEYHEIPYINVKKDGYRTVQEVMRLIYDRIVPPGEHPKD